MYKKCGFKTNDNFKCHCKWNVNIDNTDYFICLYGKDAGKANSENLYDFPPPVDNVLLFGKCILLAHVMDNNNVEYVDLTIDLWNRIYDKLFGGFEDLNVTCKEDEEEIDELENIPDKYKTKDGYLKDGFVVSDSGDESDNLSLYELLEEEYLEEDD